MIMTQTRKPSAKVIDYITLPARAALRHLMCLLSLHNMNYLQDQNSGSRYTKCTSLPRKLRLLSKFHVPHIDLVSRN